MSGTTRSPGVYVAEHNQLTRNEILVEAYRHLKLAMELLDSVEAPAHIAAHVDLAAHQLMDTVKASADDQQSHAN